MRLRRMGKKGERSCKSYSISNEWGKCCFWSRPHCIIGDGVGENMLSSPRWGISCHFDFDCLRAHHPLLTDAPIMQPHQQFSLTPWLWSILLPRCQSTHVNIRYIEKAFAQGECFAWEGVCPRRMFCMQLRQRHWRRRQMNIQLAPLFLRAKEWGAHSQMSTFLHTTLMEEWELCMYWMIRVGRYTCQDCKDGGRHFYQLDAAWGGRYINTLRGSNFHITWHSFDIYFCSKIILWSS